jgi:predicted ferric reductase
VKYQINNRAVRSGIYLIIVGGLLFIFSSLLAFLWNSIISQQLNLNEISRLESLGLISLSLIFYLAIRFGYKDSLTNSSNSTKKNCNFANLSVTNDKFFKNLTDEDKEKLKESIIQCCSPQPKNNVPLYSESELR